MNIETANRLYELRKQKGYSQEELADKLGISRQAVSKWERAEASPDTDNLILLAKLYGVSLDELLNIEKSGEYQEENPVIEEEVKEESIIEERKEIDLEAKEEEYKEKKNSEKKVLKEVIDGITVFVVLIGYLLLGFLSPVGWKVYWVLFLLIPIVSTLFDAINYKRMNAFAYPVLVVLIYMFVCLRFDNVTYGLFGKEMRGFWHPLWIIFLTIPLYYVISAGVDKLLEKKYH